ncbi:MAG: CcdB family protein [Candidatus Rifleibacteriota bacterium]
MAQFSVYNNLNPATREFYPLLLNVQSTLLDGLETRLVIPLSLKSNFHNNPIKELNPIFEFNKAEYLVLTQQLAAIHAKNLGPQVADASGSRQAILSAIDLLITGF